MAVGRSTDDGCSVHVGGGRRGPGDGLLPPRGRPPRRPVPRRDPDGGEPQRARRRDEARRAGAPAAAHRRGRARPEHPVETVAELWDGEGKGLDVLGLLPGAAATPGCCWATSARASGCRWSGTPSPAPRPGSTRSCPAPTPASQTEWAADWYPDATALLLHGETRGRGVLYRYDLATGTLEALTGGPGSVSGASVLPDGTVEYTWSSAAESGQVRALDGSVVLTPPGAAPARLGARARRVRRVPRRDGARAPRPAGAGGLAAGGARAAGDRVHRARRPDGPRPGHLRRRPGDVGRPRLRRGAGQLPRLHRLRRRLAGRHHRPARPGGARGRRRGAGPPRRRRPRRPAPGA